MSEEFIIKQGRFEGPYTKLLELIESKKLSISEISLANVADEYINYIKTLELLDPLDLSQFIQVASTLMLIKAKSLLPVMEYTEEEKEVVGNLEKKLELYKELKSAELKIISIFNKQILHSKEGYKFKADYSKVPLSQIKSFTLANLHSVGLLTLAKLPNFERIRQVAVRQAIKIEHVIEKMIERISREFTSLKEFAKGISGGDVKNAKKSLIVSFLALLELLKQGGFEAVQNDGDISLMRK